MKAKTKILISSFIGLACAAVISVGSTFAWFGYKDNEEFILSLNSYNSLVNIAIDVYQRDYLNPQESNHDDSGWDNQDKYVGDVPSNMGVLRKVGGAWLMNTGAVNQFQGGDGYSTISPDYSGSVNSGSVTVNLDWKFFRNNDSYFTDFYGKNILTPQMAGIAGNLGGLGTQVGGGLGGVNVRDGVLAGKDSYTYDVPATSDYPLWPTNYDLPATIRYAANQGETFDNDYLHYLFLEFRFYTSSDDTYIKSTFTTDYTGVYYPSLNPGFGSTSNPTGGFENCFEIHFVKDESNVFKNDRVFYGQPLPHTNASEYTATEDANCYLDQFANFNAVRYASGGTRDNTFSTVNTIPFHDKDNNLFNVSSYGINPKPNTTYDTFGTDSAGFHEIKPIKYRIDQDHGDTWTYGKDMNSRPYSAAFGVGLYFNPAYLIDLFNAGNDEVNLIQENAVASAYIARVLNPTIKFDFEVKKSDTLPV